MVDFEWWMIDRLIILQFQDKGSDELSRLKPGDYNPVQKLSPHHWAAILSLYNSTFLSGGYITMLPPVQLASAVSPERAIAQRNDAEKQNNFQWQSLAIALDPIDFNGEWLFIWKTKKHFKG